MTTQTVQGPLIIRRYANRKLYDTENSKYVTLKEVVGLVAQGRLVQVVDKDTATDITAKTLIMALVETEQDLTGQEGIIAGIFKAGGLVNYVANLNRASIAQG